MVEGLIEFVADGPHLEAADVYISIEDTTYADADAVPVFRLHMPHVSRAGDARVIPFRLEYDPRPPEGRTYSLSVFVDLDGDGVPGSGDYVSFQAVRVPDDGSPARVAVRRIE